MNIRIERKPLSAEEFNALASKVGWSEVETENIEVAMSNSVATVTASLEDEVVGFGRLIGDVGMYLYIQDLIVDPAFQGQGIGTKIVDELESIVKGLTPSRGIVMLIAADSVADYYERLGYSEATPHSKFMFKVV